MPDDICNLIGQNSVQISDVLYFYRANITGMYTRLTRKEEYILWECDQLGDKDLKVLWLPFSGS